MISSNSQHSCLTFRYIFNDKIKLCAKIVHIINKKFLQRKRKGFIWNRNHIWKEMLACFSLLFLWLSRFFHLLLCRNPTYTFSGREARNSWHRGWPLGWEQTGPRRPWAFPPAGSFCWRTSKRVSSEQWTCICINKTNLLLL